MSLRSTQLLAASERYSTGFRHGTVPAGTSRGLAVSIVGDPAVDPHRAFGLAPGDALIARSTEPQLTATMRADLAVARDLGARRVLHIRSTPTPDSPTVAADLQTDLAALRSDAQLSGLDVYVTTYDVTSGQLAPPEPHATDPELAAILAANEQHRTEFHAPVRSGESRHLSVVTCMDSRIDPEKILDVAVGALTVRRNAGAHVTEEVLRGLAADVATHGSVDVLVLVHEDCKARPDRAERMRGLRADGAHIAEHTGNPDEVQAMTASYDVHTGRLIELQ